MLSKSNFESSLSQNLQICPLNIDSKLSNGAVGHGGSEPPLHFIGKPLTLSCKKPFEKVFYTVEMMCQYISDKCLHFTLQRSFTQVPLATQDLPSPELASSDVNISSLT